jgi:hypothetical protein
MSIVEITTYYTVFGYEIEGVKATGQIVELGAGGNSRMCSETKHMPSEGAGDIENHDRMTLREVAVVAKAAHVEICAQHPDAADRGCHKDADGQDELLSQCGIRHGQTKRGKAQFDRDEKRKMAAPYWR